MTPLVIKLIAIAAEEKPKMGAPCNLCGWCCLTEVCAIGVKLVGDVIPCKLLQQQPDGTHHCGLLKLQLSGKSENSMLKGLAINSGCDAATQEEILEKLA